LVVGFISSGGTRNTPRSTGNLAREANDDLRAMCFREPALVQRRDRSPFPRARRTGQTYCLGISKACSLSSMRLRGIHRSRTRIARSRARYSCGECSGFVEKYSSTINKLVRDPLGGKQTAECSARIVEEP
jgi:hypothetical protein